MLVLLPGMDGTGLLFEPLVTCFQSTAIQGKAVQGQSMSVQVLTLPTDGAQDYRTLTAKVSEQLPKE